MWFELFICTIHGFYLNNRHSFSWWRHFTLHLYKYFIVCIPYFLDRLTSLTVTFFFLVIYGLCYVVIDLVSAILISNVWVGWLCFQTCCCILLDYITYPGASTINLSFWLNWFLDKVSDATETRSYEFEISTTPHLKVEFSAPGMRRACVASTL